MRVLVTGGAGMLGRDLVPLLEDRSKLVLTRADADLAEEGALERAVGEFDPEIVFHLAAYTDVDGCESDPDRARRDNVLATRNVAWLARARGARLVFVSTDYVFDGRADRPIPPEAPPSPVNEYGRSKLAAEGEVRAAGVSGWIVRTSWLIGPHGRNFVEAIRERARAGRPLRVVDDQRGSPTFTFDLAPALYELGIRGGGGVLHVTNQGDCTWYDLAAEILRLEGLEVPLERATTEEIARPARRPSYSVLDNTAANAILGGPLPRWQESLARYLEMRPARVA